MHLYRKNINVRVEIKKKKAVENENSALILQQNNSWIYEQEITVWKHGSLCLFNKISIMEIQFSVHSFLYKNGGKNPNMVISMIRA